MSEENNDSDWRSFFRHGLVRRLLKKDKRIRKQILIEYFSESLGKKVADNFEDIETFFCTTIGEYTIPRNEIKSVDINWKKEDIINFLSDNEFTKYVLINGSLDKIIGFLKPFDLYKFAFCDSEVSDLRKYAEPPLFFPYSIKTVDFLKYVGENSLDIAVILDEYGGTDGIVKASRVVFEIAKLFSNSEIEPYEMSDCQLSSEGIYVVSGRTLLSSLEDKLDTDLKTGEECDYSTVGGLIFYLAERVPNIGDTFTLDNGIVLKVIEADERYIKKVSVDFSSLNKIKENEESS